MSCMRSKDGERKKKARERQTEIERNKRERMCDGKSERQSKRFRGRRTKTDKRIDRGRKREREKNTVKNRIYSTSIGIITIHRICFPIIAQNAHQTRLTFPAYE